MVLGPRVVDAPVVQMVRRAVDVTSVQVFPSYVGAIGKGLSLEKGPWRTERLPESLAMVLSKTSTTICGLYVPCGDFPALLSSRATVAVGL